MRRVAALLVPLLLLLLGPGPVTGQAGAEAPAERWTVEDVLRQESAGDFRFSPDGRWIVWVRTRMDPEEGRRESDLWITRLDDGESWALTRGPASDRSPRFSPDGTRIAFTSSREVEGGEGEGSGSQLWMLRLAGGEPWPVTTDLRGLRDFAWKGASSDTLVVAARERERQFEREREEEEDDARAVDDPLDIPPVRLWHVAPGDGGEPGSVRRITTNDDWIQGMAVSPDGRRAVTVSGIDPSFRYDAENPPRTHLVDLGTGRRDEILTEEREERIIPRGAAWRPDGGGFYFQYSYSTHPKYRSATVTRMAFYDVGAGRLERVDLGWDRGLGQGFQVVDDGFVALLADGVRDRPARYRSGADGWVRSWIRGDHGENVWGWRVSDDGARIAYVRSTTDTPPQPWSAALSGEGGAGDVRMEDPVRLARLNPSLADKPKPRGEIVTWTGARGDEVEGIVHYPLDYEAGRRYPLVLNIHGGPAGRDRDAWGQSWADPLVLFNQKGSFVLQVNYHGSCCYGLEWVESIGGGSAYYDLPVADIEAGVDHLIGEGLVHPDSVATQGWSNGAILSTALTVESPERYRASLAGAGDVEWISDWANVDFGAAFDQYYFGASPLEDPQRYIELSPFFRMDRVRTPTLIFFGTEDRNVPPSQGWSHFRALQQLGNTEVRFVLFPGEPHGLGELAHQRRKVEEELRWLDRHLWGRDAEPPTVVKEGSPLAGLLARADAARVDGAYGVDVDGTPVPETVPGRALSGELASVEVGRFEVTRAQWAAFDDAYRIPAGTGNHPVSGVSFQEARRYAAWLARTTGRSWRLPTAAEARALAATASSGVTLDWWAGYAPGPDDEAALRERLSGLSSVPAPLARSAGSVAAEAAGPGPHLFDAGGNVAEWAVAGDGSGVAVGLSAAQVKAPPDEAGAAPPEYRGLRVVREVR